MRVRVLDSRSIWELAFFAYIYSSSVSIYCFGDGFGALPDGSVRCCKVKSLDKKLRKLEVAMSSAKDDPSMVYAKWGDRDHMDNSSDSGSSCTSGSTPCSEQASIASTPRHPRDDSPLPYECSSPFQESDYTMSTEAVSPIPVRVCKHESDGKAVEPVKIELCFSSESLQHVAHVNGNIMFALQGVDEVLPERGTTPVQQIHSNFPDCLLPPNQAAPMSIFVKAEPIEEDPDTSGMDMGSLSDDDLIALLAHCAGSDHSSGHARSASFASHRRTDLSDAEIMQALAGCCEAPIAYGLDQEEGASTKHTCARTDVSLFLCAELVRLHILPCIMSHIVCMNYFLPYSRLSSNGTNVASPG